jgi:hypothetical protein
MMECGAGLAHGEANMDAAYICVKGNAYSLCGVAIAYGVVREAITIKS